MNKKHRIAKRTTIIVGMCGSIAAYKGCELASKLTANGWNVKSILTFAATKFITPLSLQAVTGNPCFVDMFKQVTPGTWDMYHISLSNEARLVVVAPASADFIARCAQGRASDLLSSVILSTRAPILIAPAMNQNMYSHPLTRKNIKTLKDLGYHIIGPEKGRLACGTEGIGRMSEPEDIILRIKQILKKK